MDGQIHAENFITLMLEGGLTGSTRWKLFKVENGKSIR